MKHVTLPVFPVKFLLSLLAILSFEAISQTESSVQTAVQLSSPLGAQGSSLTAQQDDGFNKMNTVIVPPENWYQAEVILFTQQGNLRNEAPPENYLLDFPENWLQLTEPQDVFQDEELSLDLILAELASEQGYLYRSQSNVLLQSEHTSQHHLYLIPEASIPYKNEESEESVDSNNELSETITEKEADPYVPEYEQPFVRLDAPDRDLNESASALDRRGYGVLFHQAWRFQITAPDTAPWIIIKAGATGSDRFQLEGSIRFYRSRFLHFETNLWRLKFSDSVKTALALPPFPAQEESDKRYQNLLLKSAAADLFSMGTLNNSSTESGSISNNPLSQNVTDKLSQLAAIRDAIELSWSDSHYALLPEAGVTTKVDLPLETVTSGAISTEQQAEAVLGTEFGTNIVLAHGLASVTESDLAYDFESGISGDLEEGIEGNIKSDSDDSIETDSQDQPTTPEYPIESVWVMKKSQRLQEADVYYLDHPEMGALVTIKRYEPELLNPPMNPDKAEEILDELIGESTLLK